MPVSAQSCPTLCSPMDCTCQAPLSMAFPRQEYWSGLPFPTLRDVPDPGIKPTSLVSPALAVCFFTAEPPGKPTAAAAAAKSLQSCPTLCDPIDCSPPGSAIPGILQARTLEWVAISFSTGCLKYPFPSFIFLNISINICSNKINLSTTVL